MPNSIAQHTKVPITNNHLFSALALLLLCLKAFPQQEGFFKTYDNLDGNYCPSAVIEISDGSFIMAAFDQYVGSGLLVKLSNKGELLNRVPIRNGNVGVFIDGIYRNPDDTTLYCAIGSLHYHGDKPYVLHFDDDLNLTEEHVVDLPGNDRVFLVERALQTHDGDFLFATSLDAQNGYHRLYMKIATDGTLKNFHEATDGCASEIVINALFEFPEGGYYGDYRISHKSNYNHDLIDRLFGFDDDFVFDTINEFSGIYQQNGNTTYLIKPITIGNGTALPYGDSCLLLSDKVYELYTYGNHSENDRSSLLTLTDLEGNIINYLVVGSMNDTVEYPVSLNSVDFVKSGHDEVKDVIYHGSFGTCDGYAPCENPNRLTITQTDGELNISWQKTFSHPTKYLMATYLLATHDGGCFVTGAACQDNHYYPFALKINTDGTLGTDEIVVEDVRPYICYPNPAKSKLHLQFSPDVTPTSIDFYDLQGHLVLSQSMSLENINIQGLAAGQYLMKITFDNGKAYTDKVVKE